MIATRCKTARASLEAVLSKARLRGTGEIFLREERSEHAGKFIRATFGWNRWMREICIGMDCDLFALRHRRKGRWLFG
jgi:hypothetical protein